MRTAEAFARVREFVVRKVRSLSDIGLNDACEEIACRRKKNKRYYAHTSHFSRIICVWGAAFRRLPAEFQIGILLHEYGHFVAGASEEGADQWVFRTFGIPLEYRDHKGIPALEWVDPRILSEVGLTKP